MNHRRTLAGLTLTSFLWWSWSATAQIGPLGTEFQVDGTPLDGVNYPDVAEAANGTFVVVWINSIDGGSVFARRYDSAGQPLGTQFQVNSYTTDYQGRPAVAAAADGSFVVTWSSQGQDGDAMGVFGQRYDSAGQALGTEFQVNSYTTGSQNYTTVSATADGAFVVAWNSENDGDAYGVAGQRFDSAGQPVGTEFQVNTYTTGPEYIPSVTVAGDGAFVVSWMSQPDQDGNGQGVYAQRFDSTGQVAGTEFRVNTYTTGDQFLTSVAGGANGAFVVVWGSDGQDGSNLGTFAQRYDSAGQTAGTEFQVNSYTTGRQGYPPSVAAGTDGAFVVVWHSVQDGSSGGVFGQRYTSAGQTAGSEFQVNTYTTDYQYLPEVSVGPSGSFVVVWLGAGQSDDFGIFAQRFGSTAVCGDSTTDPGEQCDDGDAEDGDGCDSNCTTTACGNGIITIGEDCDDGNVANGDGCSATCQDSAAPENAIDTELTAGETISSDGESDGATEADPVETSITMSVGTASVTIDETLGGPEIPGYALIGQQVQIDFVCSGSPCPSATDPLTLSFRIDASRIPSGIDETNLAVLRDGAAVPACSGGPGVASPDPCISNRTLEVDGDISVTILTSQASLWSFASTTCSPTPLSCDDPGKGVFLVKKTTGDPTRTKLLWKWLRGTIAGPSAFGDPLTGTSYALCVYDDTTLVESHVIAPGGNCPSNACWKVLGTKGFGYKNTAGNDAGITKVLLKSGDGKAKILVKGKGSNVALPASDPIYAQTPSVAVQLVSSSGGCWDAVFPGPAKKSTGEQFKDIIP